MSIYTDDTYKIIWHLTTDDGEIYTVTCNKLSESYEVFRTQDIEEVSHTNYAVKKDYKKLTGTFRDTGSPFYVVVSNNLLHCDTGLAAFVPHGLVIFKPKEYVEHYAVYGKIMSQHSWLTWVKGTSSWPQAMANLLGSKSPE